MKLDRKRPCGEVIGSGDGRCWEQDGRFFDAKGEEIAVTMEIPGLANMGEVLDIAQERRNSVVEAVRQMGGINKGIRK